MVKLRSRPRKAIVRSAAGTGASVGLPSAAMAHQGQPLAPHDLWSAWSFEPGILIPLIACAVLYAVGTRALWHRTRAGRGLRRSEVACFAAGWIVLAVALVSPLHSLGDVLFSAHMTQHTLLILVAAPLIVLGRPLVAFIWGLPVHWRRPVGNVARLMGVQAVWRMLTDPAVVWVLHAGAIWVWHAPRFYTATLESDALHALQHAAFLITALLFWWVAVEAVRRPRRAGVAVLYLFTTAIHTGALGGLLTFAPSLWYATYASTSGAWGLMPLQDQQLAGLIMWLPGGIIYMGAALAVMAPMLQENTRAAARAAYLIVLLAVLPLGAAACSIGMSDDDSGSAVLVAGGDSERGRQAIREYGCGSCHTIGGVTGANSLVGPALDGLAERVYIGGVLSNSPDNLIRWIMSPRSIDPRTAMPDLGVSESDARNITSYLYTLR